MTLLNWLKVLLFKIARKFVLDELNKAIEEIKSKVGSTVIDETAITTVINNIASKEGVVIPKEVVPVIVSEVVSKASNASVVVENTISEVVAKLKSL